ncbi:MAG: hypothetical protein PHY48_15545, partial [Candidatus Cloacimonetes bacterium]|nr:hypothetical protein [Candidatus Cloacimonadota bacterium]
DGAQWHHTYDAENRLITSTNTVSSVYCEYAYDYQSRRISKTTLIPNPYSSLTTKYIWDGWNIAAEIIIDQTIFTTNINYYTWGLDLSGTLQGAGGVGGLLSDTKVLSSETNTYFAVGDANGNVTEYINSIGATVAHGEHNAFGETKLSGSMKDQFTHWFSSKPFDKETGLVSYELRFYEPLLATWLNRDPIGIKGGLNEVGFVLNNPINSIDLLGLDTYLLFWGDESGVPFQRAAEGKKSDIESSWSFNKKNDKAMVVGVKSFDDVQRALKANKCIKEIYFYVHAGPGIMFLDMSSIEASSNISVKGGKHKLSDYESFDWGDSEPEPFNSIGVSSLYTASMKKTKWCQSKNKVYVYGCDSKIIASKLGAHFKAKGKGVSGTCYFPVINGTPVPATGSYYFWLLLTGQVDD